MRIPQPITPFRALPQPITVLRSGSSDKIEVPYIRCLNGWVPKCYEIWALAEDGVREVHLYAMVRLLSKSREDTFTPTYLICDDSIFLSWVVEL